MADQPGTNPLALCEVSIDVAHGRSKSDEQDATQLDNDNKSRFSNTYSVVKESPV
jgi:hypothetical protein